jgi:hypothetical protein
MQHDACHDAVLQDALVLLGLDLTRGFAVLDPNHGWRSSTINI